MTIINFVCRAVALGLMVVGPATATTAAWADINRPFGSHPMTYAVGSTLPNHVSQAVLDQAVRDFYDQWKAQYLEQTCGVGRYVVRASTGSGDLTVSEAHGYGMMLAALMAGHDANAQSIFDGMYGYFLEHPTAFHDHLMSWKQSNSCNNVEGNDSATDGDLDIAFALLLADKQWGSCGSTDYLSAAMAVLADVLDGEVDASHSFTLLGDWVSPGDAPYNNSTRSSDFMVDHLASFASATGSSAWTDLRDSLYSIIASLQSSYSPGVGLVPDFIVAPATSPAPAPAGFLEGSTDGAYSYNACRVPWRLATDFVTNGDVRAKASLDLITAWIRTTTAQDPSVIGAGYALNGSPISGTNYSSLAFKAPFGVGAMVSATNQSWINDSWDEMVGTPLSAESYYENTIKMLAMVVMSGNWWAPEKVGAPTCTPSGTAECTNPAAVGEVKFDLSGLDKGAAGQKLKLSGTLFFPGGVPATLDAGAQILVEDQGSGDAAIFDLRESATAVPGAGDPTCDGRDGWMRTNSKVQYRNKSGALDAPTCTVGSANGLAKIQYRLGSGRDLPFLIQTKRSTIAAPVGPLRVTLVLGDTQAAGDAGECGVTGSLGCEVDAKRARCE